MKNMKRALSWFLAVCMILTCLSTNAYATEVSPSDDTTASVESTETVTPDDSTATEATQATEATTEESAVAETEATTSTTEESVDIGASEEEQVNNDAASQETTTETVIAGSDALTVETDASSGGTLDTSEFATMVLIDCGRGYYSVENIEKIIDTMSANHYKYLMLGFGNDGLRFVLDDMSVTVGDTTYDSSTVKNAVISANDTLQNNNGNGQWTQSQMDSIISYAKDKGIGIVPMLNCPGHAYSVYKAMSAATGITNCYTAYGSNGSVNQYNYSIDLSNETVKGFVEGLVEKYISYFDNKGCKFFNLGCDETKYAVSQTVTYVNDVCSTMSDSMVPMAFCDILSSASGYPDNLVGIDWQGGYLSGHYNFNANDNWYYVLGNSETSDGWSTYYRSKIYTNSTSVKTTLGKETAYGSILAVWNDSYLASDNYITNIQNLIVSQATASVNAEYFPVYSSGSTTTPVTPSTSTDAAYTSETSVTVSAGGTKVVTTTGANNAGTYTTADTSVATVAVTGKDATEASESYDSASNVYASILTGSNTSWTKTSYYYKASDGNYYPVYAYKKTSSSGGSGPGGGGFGPGGGQSSTTTYYWGYSTTDSSSNVTSISSSTNSYTSVSNLYTKTTIDATEASTTITFTGVAEGTTSVVIGGVKYNVTVTAEDLSTVTAQTIHMYISTFGVWKIGDSSQTTTVSVSANDAYGVDGIDISSVVPAEGSWAYAADSSSASTVFWKGVKLTYANRQSATSSEDKSMSGVNYDKIRYYGGKWSVHDMDNDEWVDIASDDEVDAYYLQKTEITSEVTTYVKDWAYTTSNCTDATSSNVQKALSFAVVYPDGQLSPSTEDDIYTDSTLIYWNTTQNMFIRVGVNEVYEVEKITYTAGERINSSGTPYGSTTGNWKSTDRISWDKTTSAGGVTWYDETTCWTPDDSSEPVIDCSQIDAFSYSKGYYTTNDAILVLIYLKPVTTEDSLTVKYVDDTNDNEFLNYSLNVTNTSTEAKGTFLNRLVQTSTVQAGEFTLDDDAYVTNAKGTNETFQKDLQKIPALIGTSYATGFYDYTKADISEDGKTLTLHYNVSKTIASDVDYVVDFGLPVTIPISDIVGTGTYVSASLSSAIYGNVVLNGSTITYTPSKILLGKDSFKVAVKYSDSTITKTVGIYPATTVFYEEGFASYTGTWTSEGSKGSGTQTKQKAGSSSDEYGKDAKYSGESTGASNGTEATTTVKGSSASFGFTGKGVDIYANCKSDTGVVSIRVKNASGANVKSAIVDTTTDQAIGSISSSSEEYSLPILSITGLTYGDYTVEITSATAKEFDFDGFRVYGTLEDEVNLQYYKDDLEDNPSYVELRNEVLNTKDSTLPAGVNTDQVNVYLAGDAASAVVVTDTSKMDQSSAETLLNNGPKNELFLASGQAVTFTVDTDREVQLGMKAVTGSVTVSAGSYSGTITSSTDMFYTVKAKNASDKTITITNTSGGILSITKVKVCDDPNFTFGTLTESDLDEALIDLGLKEDDREPSSEATTEVTTPTEPTTEPSTEAPTQPTTTEQKGQTQPAATTAQQPTTQPTAAAITTQPKGIKVKKNKKASFTVGAVGDNLTYQWQVKKNKKWVNVSYSGSKTATMTVKAKKSLNKKKFRCVVKDGYGNVVTTKAVTLKVK